MSFLGAAADLALNVGTGGLLGILGSALQCAAKFLMAREERKNLALRLAH